VQHWLDEFDWSGQRLQLMDEKQAIAYGDWFDEAGQRFEGRRGRIAEATPVVPPPLWFVLDPGSVRCRRHMLLFADPSERLFVHSTRARRPRSRERSRQTSALHRRYGTRCAGLARGRAAGSQGRIFDTG
jgi:hypothetical protein